MVSPIDLFHVTETTFFLLEVRLKLKKRFDRIGNIIASLEIELSTRQYVHIMLIADTEV